MGCCNGVQIPSSKDNECVKEIENELIEKNSPSTENKLKELYDSPEKQSSIQNLDKFHKNLINKEKSLQNKNSIIQESIKTEIVQSQSRMEKCSDEIHKRQKSKSEEDKNEPIINLNDVIISSSVCEKNQSIDTKQPEKNNINEILPLQANKKKTIPVEENSKVEKNNPEKPLEIHAEVQKKEIIDIKQEKGEKNNLIPDEKQKKKKKSIDKIIVGPEIFVQLKDEKIFSKYTQGQILGQGAYGTVSLVTQKSTGMIRAMKTIKKSSLIQEEEKKIFSELVILKNLDHPHIVKLYELFQDEKNYYLITEYCDGGELFERIQLYEHFSERIAADLMKQILQAVVYCHSQNIVHRDLKPENILFDTKKNNAILKIIDFGTSRKFDPNKKMRKLMGTPYYIAPEVLNKQYNEKCDVWSCGVIMYILLCGYPPFVGYSENEIFNKIRSGKFTFEDDWDKISSDAKSLIKKMLEFNVDKRISASEALNHTWVQRNKTTSPIPEKTLKNLAKFESTHRIQAALYTFIVSQIMSSAEKENLQKIFITLDKNGDGKLSEEELIEAYTKINGKPADAKFLVKKILKASDHNSSGKIDYTEFLVAATNREKILSANKIEQAFKMFDIDGNGFITKNELKNVMGSEVVNEGVWNELLEECDINKDGKISLQEFISLLTNKRNLTIDMDE